jgi:hypothetical protein
MLYKIKIIGYTKSGLQSIEGGIYADTLRKTFGRQGFCGGSGMRRQAWLLSK